MTGQVLPTPTFPAFRILTVVAMILAIVGMTSNMTIEGMQHPAIETKVGMILYVVSWVALLGLLLAITSRRSGLERGENRILIAVSLCMPFILVRVIYACLIVFLHNSVFSMLTPNPTAMLCMDVLEEIFVAVIILGFGFTLSVRAESDSESKPGVEPPIAAYPQQYQPQQYQQSGDQV